MSTRLLAPPLATKPPVTAMRPSHSAAATSVRASGIGAGVTGAALLVVVALAVVVVVVVARRVVVVVAGRADVLDEDVAAGAAVVLTAAVVVVVDGSTDVVGPACSSEPPPPQPASNATVSTSATARPDRIGPSLPIRSRFLSRSRRCATSAR